VRFRGIQSLHIFTHNVGVKYDTFGAKHRSDSQAGMHLDDTTSRTVDDGAITSTVTKPVSLVSCHVIGQNPSTTVVPHGRTMPQFTFQSDWKSSG